MVASLDPKLGSSLGHETRTGNKYRHQKHNLEISPSYIKEYVKIICKVCK